jgi:hypothetical protein
MLLVICVSIPYQIIIDVYGNGTKLNMFVWYLNKHYSRGLSSYKFDI